MVPDALRAAPDFHRHVAASAEMGALES
jgi:hypothetical protein